MNNSILKELYDQLSEIIDVSYRKKNISSENLLKYFSNPKNFKHILSRLKEIEYKYNNSDLDTSFEDTVKNMLFNRILKDRIYYEKDNLKENVNELKYLKLYEQFNESSIE